MIYQAAVLDYRVRLGWPTHTVGTTVWLTPRAHIEAFNVSRDLGERVLDRLCAIKSTPPVINIPGPPDRWALLTQPHDGAVAGILAQFADQDVGYAYLGHHQGRSSEWGIDLPPSRHPGREPLTWITPPNTPLPPTAVVVRALADVLTR